MTEKKPFAPLIRTQAALEEAWHELMGPWSFGGRSVWMMLIVEDRPLPQLTEITDSDEPLGAEELTGFTDFLRQMAGDLGPDLRLAFLRSRPGGPDVTENDRAWARLLYDVCRSANVVCDIVHLATEDHVRPLPPDEVAKRRSA